jgi:two-component system sensor histidine kinase/response regulator
MSQKILIIDDNRGDKELLSDLLKDTSLKYEILWAEDGESGLAMAKKENPAVVFLDTLMPGMDGYDICKELKSLGKEHMYIIMMTGSLDAVGEAKAKNHGANGYCIKLPESILEALLVYHQQKSTPAISNKTMRMLLVEDNVGDQKLIKEVIKESGLNIELSILDQAEQITSTVEKLNVQLILMDVMMPGLTGGDAVKLLRNNAKTKHIPIVFLTGVWAREDEKNLSRGINIEGQLHPALAKPIDLKRFISVVNKYL